MTARSLRAFVVLVVAALVASFVTPAYANDIHELGSAGGNWDYIKDAGTSTEHSLGQGFKTETSYTGINVHHVGVYLQRVGTPENACVVVSLRDTPAGWDLASTCVPAKDVTTAGGWVDFFFTPTVAVIPGAPYYIYVRYYGSCDTCMRLHWGMDSYRGPAWPMSRYGQDGTGCCWWDDDTDLKFLVAVDHTPVVRSETAVAASSTSATVAGTLVDDSDNDAQLFFEYGPGSLTYGTPMHACAEGATCTETLTGLTPGTVYQWRACAQNAVGTQCGETKTFRQSGTNTAPNLPSSPNPAHNAVGVATSTGLSWTGGDPDGHAVTYTVYLDAGATASTPRCTAAPTPSCPSSALGGLVPGTTYTWFVIAKDPGGLARTGPEWTFRTASWPNPAPYRASTPTPAHGATGVATTADLSWSGGDPEGEPVTYNVYLRASGGSFGVRCWASSSATCGNASLGGLTPGTTYEWRVDTSDGVTTTTGTTWSFTVASAPNTPPAAPHSPTPADGATARPTNTTVAWWSSDPDGDDLTYTVYLDAGATASTPRCTNTASALCTSSGLGGLSPDTWYAWRVVARDEHGATASGPTWTFRTGPANNPPNPPASPTPSHGATGVSTTTSLAWIGSDPDGHTLDYTVFFDEGTTATTPRCSGPSTTCASTKLPTLFGGRTYAWRVNASDRFGGVVSGPTWTFTTAPANRAPYRPSFPAPALGARGVLRGTDLSWTGGDPDGDIVRYDVYLDDAAAGTRTVRCAKTTLTTCPNSAFGQLHKGIEYRWEVRAYDGRGGITNGIFNFFTSTANTAPNPASAPSPADGSNTATAPVSLSWTGKDPDADALKYDVYLDEGATAATRRCENVTTPACPSTKVGPLKQGVTYAWKVVSKDPDGLTRESPTWTFTTTWTEHWGHGTGSHREVLRRVYRDAWVAVFHDPSVTAADAAWVGSFASRVVAYAHTAYGSMVSYPIHVVLHQGRHGGGHAAYYASPSHDFRNTVDMGAPSWTDSPYTRNLLLHEIAHVVESTSHGKHTSPAYDLVWDDGPWPELFTYDVYQALARTEPRYLADVKRVHDEFVASVDSNPVEGTKGSYRWFRDFFHPLWRLRGAAGWKRYHELVGAYWRLKSGSAIELDDMRMGEFLHFASGAMRRDLRGLATHAFGWPEGSAPAPNWTTQLDDARLAFPAVTYPRCDATSDAPLRVYRDELYGGGCLALGDDARDLSYEFLLDGVAANDVVSSLRVLPGWKAVLYDGANFTGASVEVTGEQPRFVALPGVSTFDNKATSIRLVKTI